MCSSDPTPQSELTKPPKRLECPGTRKGVPKQQGGRSSLGSASLGLSFSICSPNWPQRVNQSESEQRDGRGSVPRPS